jgi:phage baseplate assembly protein W
MSNTFSGSGRGYPLQIGTSGNIRGSSGVRRIEESIRIILGTQYGERVMRPRYGSNLKSLVFAPNNEATANLAHYYVQQGLGQWEPRIEVLDVLVTNDNQRGLLNIEIHYRLRATQEEQSITIPFALEAL